jgi:hypothetical protein
MTDTQTDSPVTIAADNKPRTATPGKNPVVDPDAPYGYMRDPKTGETRPKKRPGKQGKASPPAPRERASNKTRAAKTVPTTTTDYRSHVMGLLDGVWTLAASIPSPEPGVKILGRELSNPVIRVKAQAAIMKDNGQGLVNGIGIMAQHSAPVRNFIVKAGDESGPAWILPAMMALLPFAAQSAAMWRADMSAELVNLANRTDQEFDELVKGAMVQSQAEMQSADMLAAMDAAERSASNGTEPSPS